MATAPATPSVQFVLQLAGRLPRGASSVQPVGGDDCYGITNIGMMHSVLNADRTLAMMAATIRGVAVVALKHSEWKILNDAYAMHGGYVLDFTNPSFAEFFEELGIHIYDGKYSQIGPSKGKHLRAFIEIEDAPLVVRVLRRLWERSEEIPLFQGAEGRDAVKAKFFDLLNRIEGGSGAPQTDVIERFRQDETLEELVAALQRDLEANRPAAAMDRLHTYCLIKFSHLLQVRGIDCERSEPLNSRVGKYVKALQAERDLKDMTTLIIKSAIGVFDKFNHVRNNRSLAHDNDLLDPAEARFIYDSVAAFLRFVKTIEPSRFGA